MPHFDALEESASYTASPNRLFIIKHGKWEGETNFFNSLVRLMKGMASKFFPRVMTHPVDALELTLSLVQTPYCHHQPPGSQDSSHHLTLQWVPLTVSQSIKVHCESQSNVMSIVTSQFYERCNYRIQKSSLCHQIQYPMAPPPHKC